MKKIICLLAVVCCSYSLFAQDSSMNNNMMDKSMSKMKDCVYMKDGKMMSMMHGKSMMLDKDMTLKSGTTVMTDGTVKMKDGSTTMLKDGQYVTMDGKVKDMKMDHSMMMKDSTKMQ